jgi:hypothetical protein
MKGLLLMFGLAFGCGGEQAATSMRCYFDGLFAKTAKYTVKWASIKG